MTQRSGAGDIRHGRDAGQGLRLTPAGQITERPRAAAKEGRASGTQVPPRLAGETMVLGAVAKAPNDTKVTTLTKVLKTRIARPTTAGPEGVPSLAWPTASSQPSGKEINEAAVAVGLNGPPTRLKTVDGQVPSGEAGPKVRSTMARAAKATPVGVAAFRAVVAGGEPPRAIPAFAPYLKTVPGKTDGHRQTALGGQVRRSRAPAFRSRLEHPSTKAVPAGSKPIPFLGP